jgi:type II secretory pathway pseudopilin PulG
MLSVVPLPWRIVIGLVAVLVLYGAGVATGYRVADQAAEVARLQKEAKDARALAEARAHDAHAAKEAADLGRQQYLDEQALVADLKAKVAAHDEQAPRDPEPASQADPAACPGPGAPLMARCPDGLSDARARWLRELATGQLGRAPDPAGAARAIRDTRSYTPAP